MDIGDLRVDLTFMLAFSRPYICIACLALSKVTRQFLIYFLSSSLKYFLYPGIPNLFNKSRDLSDSAISRVV